VRRASVVERASIIDVLEAAGAPFKRRGYFVTFRCPCHDDQHASASGGERSWRCFACAAKGGLLELGVALGLGADYAAVARRLELRRQ
jgi:Rieske Fe-S protein